MKTQSPRWSDISSLIEDPACFEWRSEYMATYDRVSPYILRTPSPFSRLNLAAMGSLGIRSLRERIDVESGFNLIGIASRGIPLATSIAMSLEPSKPCQVSTIGKDGSFDFDIEEFQGACNILVDNAIVTGTTLIAAWRFLKYAGISVEYATHFFDRQEYDAGDVYCVDKVRDATGLEVVPMLCASDLYTHLTTPNRDALARYLYNHGVPPARRAAQTILKGAHGGA